MKARHILICLALSLWGTGLQAQTDLPQVFSPNAAELGKYGKIPVSYFNGLPNISIPLTELHAKNYTLPIYLTYHASGNKPDQHPGWVGLGWTLHAGGCINRIVNGMKDEMSVLEYDYLNNPGGDVPFEGVDTHPGYYYHADSVQITNWADTTIINNPIGELIRDRNPDEFQVCLDDIQASFYIYGENDIRIVSRTDADFKVDLQMVEEDGSNSVVVYPSPLSGVESKTAKRFHYFKSITITSKDGTKYYFGGDDSSIEYSMPLKADIHYRQDNPAQVPYPVNHNRWICSATASTWYLTKIERPDGEVIHFVYEKDGTPIVRQDIHHGYTYDVTGEIVGYDHFDTRTEPSVLRNISYTLLQPSYLKTIRCGESTDSLTFSRARTTELAYPITEEEFKMAAGTYDKPTNVGTLYTYDQIMSENYYMQLTGISGPSRNVRFLYSADTDRRLTLNEVRFMSGNTTAYKYSMDYNTTEPLPGYQAKQTDLWGYYNGIYYGNTQKENLEAVRRQVNPAKAQAEILTAIHYPTGGRTELYYEGHTYAKEMKQMPMRLVERNANLPAGGVRVSEIRDIDATGNEERRYFDYAAGGFSSGILAGTPRLFIGPGNQSLHYYWTGLSWLINGGSITMDAVAEFTLNSENPVRPLSTTDGSHVTYSRVTESRSDGSSTVFEYSNHDSPVGRDTEPLRRQLCDSLFMDAPFNSHELFRGLLLKRTDLASDGHCVRMEENTYATDTTGYMNAVCEDYACGGHVGYYSFRKIYTGFPYLKQKVEKEYSDSGNNAFHTLTTDYTYDSHRRLTEVKRTSGGVVERDRYTYTGDYTNAPYSGMIQRNMVSLPVEHLHYRKDYQQPEKLVGAELVTWTSSGSYYVPSGKWSAGLGGTGVDAASFTVFSGTGKDSRYGNTPDLSYTHYDANGNLVLSEDRGVRPTTYLWTPDGCRPAAIVPGASVSYVRRDSSNVAKNQVYALTLGQTQIKEFECVAPFTLMLALMCPSGQNWFVEAYVDGERYPMTRINSSYTGGDWSGSGLGQYPFSLQIPLSGGAHSVRVRAGQNYHPDYATDIGCTFIINYREKRITETTVPGPTVVFEDFEEDGNHTAEAFRSGKSRKGVWTHALNESFGPYWVDYRVFRNGRWNYVRQSASGSSVTISEGTAPIDHVRIYPMGSLPESYTWWPDGNLRSRTDAQGVTESYRYDGLGRLSGVYDNDGNKVEGYQYNYQNR